MTTKHNDAEVFVVDDVSVAHGDLVAVWNASFSLRAGSVTALVGRNGAGKTTLISGICGLLPLRSGTVQLHGREVGAMGAHKRSALGLGVVQEGKRVFRDLTVRENLILGLRAGGVRRSAFDEQIDALYDRFPILRERRTHAAADLSGGQQQMLAIASALAAGPSVLLIDEPSSGLAPVFVDLVFETIEALRKEGIAILLVEQLVEEVLGGIADEVIIMDRGKFVHRDRAENLSVEDVARGIYAGF